MSMNEDIAAPKSEPRPRAVFSTQDFDILREALAHYMQSDEVKNGPNSSRVSSLYHRLGRVG